VIIDKKENEINRISFMSGAKILLQMGQDAFYVERDGGRVETFDIGEDE
jgi:hypothetical protein